MKHSEIPLRTDDMQTSALMPERPPLSVKIIYAIGQLGWALTSYAVINQLAYFYLPPETGETVFPAFIYQGPVFGILTIIGLIIAGGRLFDAFTDPLLANWSDKSNFKFGKRKTLMAIAVIPFAVFAFLSFYPLSTGDQTLNAIWLFFSVFMFYLAFTLYLVPYNALISELGHHPADRMLISTLIAVTWAIGFAAGNMIFVLKDHFENTMSPVMAWQLSLAILVGLGFIFLLFPILFLNEKRYSLQTDSSVNVMKSMAKVWKNRNFRYFTLSDLTYWLSLTIIQTGLIYYITVLLKLEESYASWFSVIAFPLSFLCYIPVNMLVKKYGKKPIMQIGFLFFALTFFLALFLGKVPIPAVYQFLILIVFAAFPFAVFGIIPTAIVSDIVNEETKKTGVSSAGMYFAFRTFMMKIGITIGSLVFTSLLLLGKSVENDFGIRMTGLTALVFCVIGLLIFNRYTDLHEFHAGKKKETK